MDCTRLQLEYNLASTDAWLTRQNELLHACNQVYRQIESEIDLNHCLDPKNRLTRSVESVNRNFYFIRFETAGSISLTLISDLQDAFDS